MPSSVVVYPMVELLAATPGTDVLLCHAPRRAMARADGGRALRIMRGSPRAGQR
jgi:hypothetical protein